ncbi:MAG: GNAT family N-acetyltransferase [Nocardioidaceae bacterium]
MTISHDCDACGATVQGDDPGPFGDAYIAHVRTSHPDWPYADQGIRNYAEATQRLTGPRQRLEAIGEVVIEPVDEDRIDDWLSFFDHDAFVDNAGWAACYCSEPHLMERGATPSEDDVRPWRENRELMIGFLRSGRSFGYLAYVEDRAAGWVNASKREACALYRLGRGADPADGDVVSVSCFTIAPPYRRHGLAEALLHRVVADAPGRGVR